VLCKSLFLFYFSSKGYGFLSENAAFCRAVTERGVFLGPTANAIHQLGDKLQSKALAITAGVEVVPGHDGVVESLDQALQITHESLGGYPVLLKAAAGGGGKGMRTCWNDQDLREAWNLTKAEAAKFFSDDRLLLEKYIERPHHIEFQVMAAPSADGTTTDVVVFPERECSIQRRNQKIIEETPSVLLREETRLAMAEQVRKLCQIVSYQSAGTCEFLVDEEQIFYFLEMNTRLQVEHPVTEAICGVDLVKAMLWVGAGWGLPEELQSHTSGIMPFQGHAIEARIYAEDPLRGFLPSTGSLTQYVEPSMEDNTPESYIRIDSGVEPGHVGK
jgi:propionyl-CoA carboxylase alpha chain